MSFSVFFRYPFSLLAQREGLSRLMCLFRDFFLLRDFPFRYQMIMVNDLKECNKRNTHILNGYFVSDRVFDERFELCTADQNSTDRFACLRITDGVVSN